MISTHSVESQFEAFLASFISEDSVAPAAKDTLAVFIKKLTDSARLVRSEERRVGKEGVRTCRFEGSPGHKKKKTKKILRSITNTLYAY